MKNFDFIEKKDGNTIFVSEEYTDIMDFIDDVASLLGKVSEKPVREFDGVELNSVDTVGNIIGKEFIVTDYVNGQDGTMEVYTNLPYDLINLGSEDATITLDYALVDTTKKVYIHGLDFEVIKCLSKCGYTVKAYKIDLPHRGLRNAEENIIVSFEKTA